MTPDHAAEVRTSIPVPVHDPRYLRIAVFVYLAILPLGHLVSFYVWGARATLADPALLMVLAVALFELGRLGPAALRHPSPLPPPRMTVVFHAVALLLVGFGVWAAATSIWGVSDVDVLVDVVGAEVDVERSVEPVVVEVEFASVLAAAESVVVESIPSPELHAPASRGMITKPR